MTEKDCSTCFFKSFDNEKPPCNTCQVVNTIGGGLAFSNWTTDSDDFWKDKEPVKDTYQPATEVTPAWPYPETVKPDYTEAPKERWSTERVLIPDDGWLDAAKQRMREEAPKALDRQVAGDHYKKLKIQPVEYCHANKLGYCESNIVKYITRWKDKGGKADLEKVKHYVDLLIQLEGLE
jgi:hypothetical protein